MKTALADLSLSSQRPGPGPEEIDSFLHFGYLPRKPHRLTSLPWAAIDPQARRAHASLPESLLIAEGVRLLRGAFQNPAGHHHVIPLSGGLDSRAILGHLVEAGLQHRVTAVTFGVAGTLDYEIGGQVARAAGVIHEPIDLNLVEVTQQDLEDTARELGNWTYLFDSLYNRLVCRRFGRDATYWSGYMGDPLAGSHLNARGSPSWQVAVHRFSGRNRYATSVRLPSPGFRPEEVLPGCPLLDQGHLEFDEELDFAIRQESCIRPLVMPIGYDYREPFLHGDWVQFILSVPRELRLRQTLYKRILSLAFPELFSLATKTNFGLLLTAPSWRSQLRRLRFRACGGMRRRWPVRFWGIHPMANYIDFDESLRERKSLKALVHDNVQNLKRRDVVPWLDVDRIWQEHQGRRANHADALILLTALEVFLKVGATSDQTRTRTLPYEDREQGKWEGAAQHD